MIKLVFSHANKIPVSYKVFYMDGIKCIGKRIITHKRKVKTLSPVLGIMTQ